MKHLRAVLVVAALLCTVSMALADNIPDPRIVIGGDSESTPIFGASFSFNSNSGGGGFYGDYLQTTPPILNLPPTGFLNVSPSDWRSLTITVPTPKDASGAYITARELYVIDAFTAGIFRYSDFQFSPDNSGLTIFFWGVGLQLVGQGQANFTGIPTQYGLDIVKAAHFSISLNDSGNSPDGSGGWKRGNEGLLFEATGSSDLVPQGLATVPEPATFSLLLGGVLALGVRVAWSKRAKKENG